MTSKISMIAGNTTPPVFCAKLVEISEEIEDIACVVNYKNGETYVFNTTMTNERKAWLAWVFAQDFKPE